MLLLDEALAGLNPAEIDNAVAVIRRIHATGISIVIVEHLLRVLNQLATRIVVLDRGGCLADGEPAAVLARPGRGPRLPREAGPCLRSADLDALYGDAQALWGVDLDVGSGETVCIIGPNGAGKTTLVHTIAGMHRAAAGTIIVDGVDVTALPAHRVCAHGVATVPEGRRVFAHMTVYDNLCLGAYRGRPRGLPGRARAVYELFPRLRERADATAPAASAAASSRCCRSAGR